MALLTIEIEDRLMADMNALALEKRQDPVEIAHTAIAEYVREHGVVRPVNSVKAGPPGRSVSVTAEARQPASLAERKCLSEQTSGMWKDRDVDGLQYQDEQRAEW